MKINWTIGGAQGSGIDTAANIFARALAKAGYYIYGNREYYSNIKGRHSYFSLTISDKRVRSISSYNDILVTYDAESIFHHFRASRGYVIYNKAVENVKLENIQSIEPEISDEIKNFLVEKGYGTTVADVIKYLNDKNVKTLKIEYDQIAKSIADELKMPLSVVERVKNIIGVAVSFRLLGLSDIYLMESVNEFFKNDYTLKINTLGIQKSFSIVSPAYNLSQLKINSHKILLDGNTAIALGKTVAGGRFQSYYPITPASDESVFLEAHNEVIARDKETGDIIKQPYLVIQAEDELAAVCMAIGSALTGTRASTSTSGPGFSLMAEAIGWAGMNEVPLVITYYMRGSPSTGMPTRSGQADLKFALNVSHGEFPRIVIASGDHLEAFYDSIWAFNLAERYQTPVIHLVEKTLANSFIIADEEEIDWNKIEIDRGKFIKKLDNNNIPYYRFKITTDGVSPRAPLGLINIIYNGEEHNERGDIREAKVIRDRMHEKRMKKLEVADEEIPEEKRVNVYGDSDSDIVILTWGSPKGAILDAIEELGINIQVIQIRMFNPFPRKLMKKLLNDKKMIIDIENNYTAQAASIIKEMIMVEPTHYILKWDGRPMTRDEILFGLKKLLNDKVKRVVL